MPLALTSLLGFVVTVLLLSFFPLFTLLDLLPPVSEMVSSHGFNCAPRGPVVHPASPGGVLDLEPGSGVMFPVNVRLHLVICGGERY